MTVEKAKKLGGKIHRIMNHTLYRKLTTKEYAKVIDLMAEVFRDAQAHSDNNEL